MNDKALSSFQLIYSTEENDSNKIHWLWESEAFAMQSAGMSIGVRPNADSKVLMYRGLRSKVKEHYENENRYINTYNIFIDFSLLTNYYPYIADISIETFFTDELNEQTIEMIHERGWINAFIKKDVKSLEHIDEGKSIWPSTGFEEMKKLYAEFLPEGKYAIRKFIDKAFLEKEERYWVLNGNLYHRHNLIPDVVREAANRLNKLGSRYYTIDATPDFIVEVNPGESSDRHGVNSAELFASWIKKEFVS